MSTTTDDWRSRHSTLLIQVGMTLFLVALVVGLFVQQFAVPRLGLSVHLLGIMQGILLTVLGLVWPRLALGRTSSRVGVGLTTCGCVAAWISNVVAATQGGSAMLPLASGPARSASVSETLITIGLRSAAIALIASTVLILWGLRRRTSE
ncbi:MAG: hydrogenase [Acidobacteria bacterium]|jgi:(hydroxyamino)benzene mutase|nr:hydrogenase [Acidobacteriota bacterium]